MIKLRMPLLAVLGTGTLFLGILASSLLGFWNTESNKEPAKIREGDFSGLPNPSDIRGSYTWNDIEKAFGVPASVLMEAFGSPQADIKVNSLEAAYAGKLPEGIEIGTDSVRLFVSFYSGLPHDPEAGTALPEKAVEVLLRDGKAEAEKLSSFRLKSDAPQTAKASPIPAEKAAASPKPSAQALEHSIVPGTLGGTTTFAELKAWGASADDIKKILGGDIGADAEAIKDFCSAKGIKFGEVKEKLQALVD